MFQCETAWVESVVEELYFGRSKIRVIGAPHTGKTFLLNNVVRELQRQMESPEACIHIDGRAITEKNHTRFVDDLISRLDSAEEKYGEAILVFDHYGHAMLRTQAAKLQSRLFSILINCPASANIGCLFAHRNLQLSNLNIRTSSFLSRLRYAPLPELSELDLEGGTETAELTAAASVAGRCPALVRAAMTDGKYSPRGWHEFWRVAAHSVALDLPREVGEALFRGDAPAEPVALDIYKHLCAPGQTLPASGIHQQLSIAMRAFVGSWPTNRLDAAKRFAGLIDRQGPSYWYDPYLLDPGIATSLTEFLQEVRSITNTKLRIISTTQTDWDKAKICATADIIESMPNIQVRILGYYHSKDLHDRHLVSIYSSQGYTVPEVRDLIVVKRNGNSIEAAFSSTPADYASYWDKATKVQSLVPRHDTRAT